jgi:hypothetical protein
MLRQYEAEDLAPLAEQLRQENRLANRIALCVLVVGFCLLYALGIQSRLAFVVLLPAAILRGSKRRRQAFTNARLALSQAMDRRGLGPLLQIRAACHRTSLTEASQLQNACDSILLRRLPRATDDELELLSAEERRILVSLLTESVGSIWTSPVLKANQEPELSDAELAMAIFLVLASLKQPGGEKSARRVLKHFKNEALREAAQEYLKAVGQ